MQFQTVIPKRAQSLVLTSQKTRSGEDGFRVPRRNKWFGFEAPYPGLELRVVLHRCWNWSRLMYSDWGRGGGSGMEKPWPGARLCWKGDFRETPVKVDRLGAFPCSREVLSCYTHPNTIQLHFEWHAPDRTGASQGNRHCDICRSLQLSIDLRSVGFNRYDRVGESKITYLVYRFHPAHSSPPSSEVSSPLRPNPCAHPNHV